MKNYAKFVLIFGIFVILGIFLFVIISGKTREIVSVDNEKLLALNDIAKDAEEKIDSPDSFGEKNYGVDFVVLDNVGNVLYTSPEADKKIAEITDDGILNVSKANKHRLPYQSIVKDGSVVGTVILIDMAEGAFAKVKLKIACGLAVMGIVFILGAVIYGIYIDRNIVKPFDKMNKFAGKVAEGKLDEPLMMEQNNMFGVFTESFDIMREELSESKKRETALQRKEKELVASLSHDLKTPITGIKLSAELLKAKTEKEGGPSDTIEKLDNIYQKADQMDKLISDLFSSTLDDLGEIKINCRDEESRILTEIVKSNDDRGLTVTPKVPDLIINIDRVRISQVIGNIIANSYKYANTKIDIEYNLLDGFLEMKLRDYGPGVSEEELPHIVNKFYRGKLAEDKEGSGLGLYISKSLMEKMNGDLLVESRGDGFTVTLLIPIS